MYSAGVCWSSPYDCSYNYHRFPVLSLILYFQYLPKTAGHMFMDSDVEIYKYWFVELIQFRLRTIIWKSWFMCGRQLIFPSISATLNRRKHCTIFFSMYVPYSLLSWPTNSQHTYINNILYTVSTATRFNASVSSSRSLKLVFAKLKNY